MGYIDRQGNVIVDFLYECSSQIHDGLAKVQLNNKWGFINKKGEVVIPFIYDDADRFRDGEAQVIKDDETFLVTMSGKRLNTPVTTDYLYQLE